MRDPRYKPHTHADDERLIQYLATHDVRTGSATTYQSIVNNEDGTSPWGAERTWAAWRSRYAHHKQDFDRRIKQYRLKHGIVPQNSNVDDHSDSPRSLNAASNPTGISDYEPIPLYPSYIDVAVPISTMSPSCPIPVSPSKNSRLTLIAERVINSNKDSKPGSQQNVVWLDASSLSPSSSFSSEFTDSATTKKMTEDHVFVDSGSRSLSSPSPFTSYLSESQDRSVHEEKNTVVPSALPARMARKRHRASGHDQNSPPAAGVVEENPRSTEYHRHIKRLKTDLLAEEEDKAVPGMGKVEITDTVILPPSKAKTTKHITLNASISTDTPLFNYTPLPSQRPTSIVNQVCGDDNKYSGPDSTELTLERVTENSRLEGVKTEKGNSDESVGSKSGILPQSADSQAPSCSLPCSKGESEMMWCETEVSDGEEANPIPSGMGWGGLCHLVN